MCYFVFLASPLTLSEVRSMLAPGLSADLAMSSGHQSLKERHFEAQTVARVTRGGCSCDLIVPRLPVATEDEARLRARYRALGLSRQIVIQALEVHRAGAGGRPYPSGHWPELFAAFVAEHARNAGPTLYCLHFSHDGLPPRVPHNFPVRTLSARQVRQDPEGWLSEDRLMLVTP